MTINYGFFPYKTGSDPHDRTYTTIQWAKFQSWLFPHEGVVSGVGNNLAITASGTPDMYVHINTGVAMAQGYYWLENTASYPVPITTAHSTYPRIDLIVAKFRLTGDDYRDAILTTHDGTPAASPTAPTPTVSADVVEIVLGQVTVAAAATQITTANITAAASQPLCGFIAAKFGKAFAGTDGSIDAASLPIHHVADPVEDTDCENKRHVSDTIAAAIADIPAPTNIYGSGVEGAVTISSDTGGYSGIHEYTNFTIDAGKVLTITGPTIILATGTVTINGSIVGTGNGPTAGAASSATGDTHTAGNPADATKLALFDAGASGGNTLDAGGLGTPYPSFYNTYNISRLKKYYLGSNNGILSLLTKILTAGMLQGESGGGGAAAGAASYYGYGGAGGKGSASPLIIIAPTIVFASGAAITLNGANGSNASGTSTTNAGAGGGGGGNGGHCILLGHTINNLGTFSAAAGVGGAKYGSSYGFPTGGANGTAGSLTVKTV